MENRGALRFVAGTLPRQPNQRRQSACTRYSPRAEPCGHGTSSGSLNPTAKPDLPWRAVSPLAQQARRSESHHRDGPSARSTGLSNAEVWSAVRRQRGRVLRAKTTPTTNRVHQKEGCPTRPKGHTSPCMNPSIKKFLESRITRQLAFDPTPTSSETQSLPQMTIVPLRKLRAQFPEASFPVHLKRNQSFSFSKAGASSTLP